MKKYFEKIKIKKEHVAYFKKLTKDNNPIHFKSKFAKKLGFRDKVIQGMLTSSFISKIIGNKVPGDGSLWTGLNLNFYKPVYLNDTINFETKIANISTSTKTVFLEIIAKNQNNQIVLEADAQVKYPKKFEKKFLLNKNKEKKENNYKTKKKITLIIGGSSEIGEKLVKKISKNNLIILTYNSKKPKITKKNLILKKLDLLNKKNIFKFTNDIKKNYFIDKFVFLPTDKILFKDFENINIKELMTEFTLQVCGLFYLTQKLKNNLKKEGSIVCMASDAVKNKPPKKMMIYSIIKSALVSMAKNLSVELSDKNVRVNCISPGIIETKLTAEVPEIVKEFYKVNSLTGRLTSLEDVANLTLFLLSNKSKNINGANLSLNGGYSIE